MNKILMFFISSLLIIQLGVEEFGIYSYLLLISNMAAMFALFGYPQLVTRQASIYIEKSEYSLLSGLWWFSFIGISFGLVVVLPIIFWLLTSGLIKLPLNLKLLVLLLLNIIAIVFFSLCQAWLRGVGKAKLTILWAMVITPLINIFVLAFYFNFGVDIDASYALIAYLCSILLVTTFIFLAIQKHSSNLLVTQRKDFDLMGWAKSLIPFFFIGGVNLLMQRSDVFMLGLLSTFEDVGIYAYAVQIAAVVAMILAVFNTLFEPEIAATLNNRSNNLPQKTFTKMTRLVTIISVVIFSIMISVTYVVYIFDLWEIVNQKFLILLSVMGLAHLINNIFGPTGTFLSMSGFERETLKALVLATTLNIILNYFFISNFGVLGASLSTLISILFANLVLSRKLKSHLGIISGPFGDKSC